MPYLHADPDRVAQWAERLDGLVPQGLRRIGVIWAGRPTHNNDRNRSALLADFAPMAICRGLRCWHCRKGRRLVRPATYYGRAPLINIGAEIQDYDDTMAILENLDLLVTVDTSVAHLAGAMGRPVWIMLPRAPDWRWLLDRERYAAGIRPRELFRQQHRSALGRRDASGDDGFDPTGVGAAVIAGTNTLVLAPPRCGRNRAAPDQVPADRALGFCS